MNVNIHDNTHLTLDERKIIQTGIENRTTKKAIADTIGKDPTTVAKEIRRHRILHPRNVFNSSSICIHLNECKKCFSKCDRYEEKNCKRRDRTPGACNKCPKNISCHLDKYYYYANKADEMYKTELVNSREGINMTTSEVKELAIILKPLLDKGQSISQIKSSHKEIKQSIHTLYNYIEMDVFKDYGINCFSLKEQVNRKRFCKKYKKRKNPVNYIGHTYSDLQEFLKTHEGTTPTEMDTVMNSLSGPYIQTFHFPLCELMIGFLKYEKTSEAMSQSINNFESNLDSDSFKQLFGLILTDRGVEFEKIDLFQFNGNTGELRLNIFYCDAYKSSQKPHVENNHNYVRDIIPNELDLSNISQEDLNLAFSHINSTPRKSLNWKTPIEAFRFYYNNADEILTAFNITEIKRDEVILKPYLLTKKK